MPKVEKPIGTIKTVVCEMMDKVMNNVLVKNPFVVEDHRASKPLYAALVPDEIFKGSHFERRFVTPFGSAWEKIAQVAAIKCHGSCDLGHTVNGTVGRESLRRIQEVLNKLEYSSSETSKRVRPDWNSELAYILAGGGPPVPVHVRCDLYIESQSQSKVFAFELKAPLPNSDQTKVSKEKLFKLLAMSPKRVDYAYYALPYNPYGAKADYKWTPPSRWFNMATDPSVLIGGEFWDLIGGKKTYAFLIKELNELGVSYRERIYREFLGIEPPSDPCSPILR
jgi:hypothetical protein